VGRLAIAREERHSGQLAERAGGQHGRAAREERASGDFLRHI
jgi:hypothetical protein